MQQPKLPLWVADVGGTSAKWRLETSAAAGFRELQTPGFNPLRQPHEALLAPLQEALHQNSLSPEGPVCLHYYGAGLGQEATCRSLEKSLAAALPTGSKIAATSDLLGAARATLGDSAGVVALFGTGSNCAYYDGQALWRPSPNLGYLLGDEASGYDLARRFLQATLHQEIPPPLAHDICQQLGLSRDRIVAELYQNPSPAAYLAAWFQPFLLWRKHPALQGLIRERLQLFTRRHLFKALTASSTNRVALAGSVAEELQEEWSAMAQESSFSLAAIKARPLSSLWAYHQAQG